MLIANVYVCLVNHLLVLWFVCCFRFFPSLYCIYPCPCCLLFFLLACCIHLWASASTAWTFCGKNLCWHTVHLKMVYFFLWPTDRSGERGHCWVCLSPGLCVSCFCYSGSCKIRKYYLYCHWHRRKKQSIKWINKVFHEAKQKSGWYKTNFVGNYFCSL